MSFFVLFVPVVSGQHSSLFVDGEGVKGSLLQFATAGGAQIGQSGEVAHTQSRLQAEVTALRAKSPGLQEAEILQELIMEKQALLKEINPKSRDPKEKEMREDLAGEIRELKAELPQGEKMHLATAHNFNKADDKAKVVAPALATVDASQHRVNKLARVVSDRMVDGPLLMNRTLMSEQALPFGSKHTNKKSVTADWLAEFPNKWNAPLPINATATVEKVGERAAAAPETTEASLARESPGGEQKKSGWFTGETVASWALTFSAGTLGALHWMA